MVNNISSSAATESSSGILIVDDNPDNLHVLTAILNAAGHKARQAPNGEFAIRSVKASAPELILLDIRMPEMDGYEVCRRLKTDPDTGNIPVIFISALGELGDKIKAFEAGGIDYITKPFQEEEVLARVNTHLELHRLQQGLEARVKERTRELRCTNDALKASEGRYRSLIGQASDGIYLLDRQGRLLDVNRRACESLGYTREEMLGLRFEDLDALMSTEERASMLSSLSDKDRVIVERRHRRKDGSDFFVEMSIAPLKEEQTLLFLAIARDVTDRKEAEIERRHFAEQLHSALIHTIEAIATVIEKRDPYTSGHQKRSSSLAVAIATEMRLPADIVNSVRLGALIHDIGKISIPAEILTRPAKLNQLEFELIKTHPQAGYDIVKDIDFPWPVAEMVLQHHERMDGSGYPRGLVGRQIALEARILAVADVVEAIQSHRPYRPAFEVEVALKEVSQGRGVLYDVDAVDACTRIFRVGGFVLEKKSTPFF